MKHGGSHKDKKRTIKTKLQSNGFERTATIKLGKRRKKKK